MKNVKVVFFAAMFMAFAAKGFGDTPTKESPEAYQKEKIDINRDVMQIHVQKNNVKSLKAQLKKDCKADRKMAAIVDRKELRKARADLMRDRFYLMAERKDLKADHRLAMRNLRKEINKDQASLRTAKKDREKCLSLGKNCDAAPYTASIAECQRQIDRNKKAFNRERNGLESDITAINKAVSNEHYAVPFEIESMTASAQKQK